jgi:hypothetical protein
MHCMTVNLFGTLEFWSLEVVSYFGFHASNFVSICFGRATGLWPGPKDQVFQDQNKVRGLFFWCLWLTLDLLHFLFGKPSSPQGFVKFYI